MADQSLQSGRIVFSLPKGDDKDDDTIVDVFVTTKYDNQFDIQLASKVGFGNGQVWEDDGQHSYSYELDVATVDLTQIDPNVRTTIRIHPNGNDRVVFNYRLELVFDDGDPQTAEVTLTQERGTITLDENNTTYIS
jgi:hypothetical protein